jgi:ribosome-binding protein aMBF1 (putative translation factor)
MSAAIFLLGKKTLAFAIDAVISSRTVRSGVGQGMTAEEFGRLIRQGRRALGMTQRDLALVINAGERFVVDLEAGKGTSQLGKALAAAQAVGVQISAPPAGARGRHTLSLPRAEPTVGRL